MLWTTAPAWLLGIVVYFFMGLTSGQDHMATMERAENIQDILINGFQFSWLLLLPLLITLYFAVRKKPVIPGMLISAAIAVMLAIFIQNLEMATAVKSMVNGFEAATGDVMVDKLLTRGGMVSMMHVTLIAFCAFAFGGIVQKAGMLDVLLTHLLKVANTVGKIIASTVASSIAVAVMTGSSFLSILIPGELFAPAYRKFDLAAKNLSRTTEDSGTVIVPLVPWSIAGVFMAGTLGVPTLAYAPWAIMCYTGFLFALFYGFTGFAIAPRINEDETIPGS
jgi:NhaC family Na+:H+ antiporter